MPQNYDHDLRRDIVGSTRKDPLPAPSDFRVSHGAKSGTLDVHATKVAGARSYEVQITKATRPSRTTGTTPSPPPPTATSSFPT